jgi:predicted ribosome quality control (RQC) complex YloA/Tae2 family protein
VSQAAFDVLRLGVYGRGGERNILVVIRSGVCRLHETFRDAPRSEKPLRFGELLKSRLLNGRIEEAVQLGHDRIVRLSVRRGEERYRLYCRLWSNAANVLLCREDGLIIDAMRRLPKRRETGGLYYTPEVPQAQSSSKPERVFAVRELPGEGSFNRRIDDWYAESGEALSLEALRAEAERQTEGSVSRIEAALESLRSKEADYINASRLKEYGDIIMANIAAFDTSGGRLEGDRLDGDWLDAEDFYRGGSVRIAVDGGKSAAENAAVYYRQYRKARNGLAAVRAEIAEAEAKIAGLRGRLERLLKEENPLRLQKLIAGGAESAAAKGSGAGAVKGAGAPGLAFIRDGWLIIVGRDARENDALLRRHVKGNDLWLHARDYAGSYVFIKQRRGKTVPLPVLLDAGSLALFYSKGRNAGKGDIFYTHVKYLRRAKGGVLGLVIPTQERNLSVTLEDWRLKQLEECRQ